MYNDNQATKLIGFLKLTTAGEPPTAFYCPSKKMYKSSEKERKNVQNYLPTDYNKLSIHDDKRSIELSFTLCLRRVISEMKPVFQLLKVGCMLLKILLFLCFHIFQHARITISVKQGPLNLLFVSFNISGPEPCTQFTCRYIQTLTLNTHSKNKCDQSSNV